MLERLKTHFYKISVFDDIFNNFQHVNIIDMCRFIVVSCVYCGLMLVVDNIVMIGQLTR